jgi:hypothetical protein
MIVVSMHRPIKNIGAKIPIKKLYEQSVEYLSYIMI